MKPSTEIRFVIERRVFHDARKPPLLEDVWMVDDFSRRTLKDARVMKRKLARSYGPGGCRIVRVTTRREVVR